MITIKGKPISQKTIFIVVLSALGVLLVGLCIGLVVALTPKDKAVVAPSSSQTEESRGSTNASGESTQSADSTSQEGDSTMSLNGSTASATSTAGKPDNTQTPATAGTKATSTTTKKTDTYKTYTKYNLDAYMTPVWKGGVVYNESVMFFPNAKTGKLDPAPLLYKPDKILSVRSSDLKTEYKEGVDYVVENGCIKLTENTSIWSWDYDDFYLKSPASVPIGSVQAPGRYVFYTNGATYADTQLAVTYTHSGKWTGTVPQYAGSQLPKTIAKLKAKQPVTVVYYGDSIMVGCEASGLNKYEPYMPIFTTMVTDQLKKTYGTSNIKEINTSVGGKHSEWGREEASNLVTKYNPDLVVIGFGMNDSGLTVEVNGNSQPVDVARYEANIRAIIQNVRSKNPNAEFILVSTTLPNPDCNGWTNWQPKYKAGLENIAKDTAGVALAPMTDMHTYLLSKKRYEDMDGNGVNHPNDFLARVYAQTIAQCLVPNLG
ncbi:SGNH/GDSL hydrolase family protein [Anaeromassilibacillus sp. SJQ-5]|jgi:hypothetical protein